MAIRPASTSSPANPPGPAKPPGLAAVRRRVLFSGRVQGVGFRATTVRLAADLPVAGHVHNLSNGTVELVAEGSPETITTLLARIKDRFQDHVDGVDSESLPAAGLAGPLAIG